MKYSIWNTNSFNYWHWHCTWIWQGVSCWHWRRKPGLSVLGTCTMKTLFGGDSRQYSQELLKRVNTKTSDLMTWWLMWEAFKWGWGSTLFMLFFKTIWSEILGTHIIHPQKQNIFMALSAVCVLTQKGRGKSTQHKIVKIFINNTRVAAKAHIHIFGSTAMHWPSVRYILRTVFMLWGTERQRVFALMKECRVENPESLGFGFRRPLLTRIWDVQIKCVVFV